jgi:hypothetical protein
MAMDNESAQQMTLESGQIVKCLVCGHDKFYKRAGLLSTAVKTFLGVDWVNPSANYLICERCRFIMWFLPKP